MAKRFLYLVRHGQYDVAPASSTDNLPDGPLTEKGRQQAYYLGKRFSDLPIQTIHCSTLTRAMQTAQGIAEHIPSASVAPSDILCECIPSVPERMKEAFAHIPAWLCEQGSQQAVDAYARYFVPATTDDIHEIIVSSGNLLSYFLIHVLGAPTDAWMLTDINHGGVSEIIIGPPRGVMLLRHNDISHLPKSIQTEG